MEQKNFIRQNVRLYPNKKQIQFLNQDIGNQRFVWNHFLFETKKLYEEEKKFLFFKDTGVVHKSFNRIKIWHLSKQKQKIFQGICTIWH